MIIGLVGQPSSGKDVASDYLVGRGWKHISTGDILREEMRKRNIPIDRPHMHDFAITIRNERGLDYPAPEAVAIAEEWLAKNSSNEMDYGIVISGMRNLLEIQTLRTRFGSDFLLVVVEVSLEVRYARALDRNRTGDNISFKEFKHQEDIERKNSSNAYALDAVIAAADIILKNNGTKEEFFLNIDALIDNFKDPK
jgi:dephospho-CoA kinase